MGESGANEGEPGAQPRVLQICFLRFLLMTVLRSTLVGPLEKARNQGDPVVGPVTGATVADSGSVNIPGDDEFAQLLFKRVSTQGSKKCGQSISQNLD